MKKPLPLSVSVTLVGELRAERKVIEELLDSVSPYISEQPLSLRRRRDALLKQIELFEQHGDGGPLTTVTLDACASGLVRQFLEDKPDATALDVINGAVVFMLGAADDHDQDEEISRAIARRESPEGEIQKGKRKKGKEE